MALAIFDLDNTLLHGDSDYSWGQFLCRKGVVDAEAHTRANQAYYEDYERGELDIEAFLQFALKPLADNTLADLNAWRDEFMREVIEPMVLPKGESLLQRHRDQGDTLMIITATNHFVTELIARRLGVDHLIATRPECVDGRFTGKVSGVPSFQGGKVERLQEWLQQHGASLEESYFYSDSQNDIPLLEKVDHPVAVDPSPALRQHAEAKGWTVMSLR
ncbi:HAD-superfamily subfamily IB hydrolase, TIGR01490 [gamma proteobacterium HTCC5015]|nr:HAD-superfamily subfamily IB hydrolase, TIGR01490 [gamma proteobacterium HTCC5015]